MGKKVKLWARVGVSIHGLDIDKFKESYESEKSEIEKAFREGRAVLDGNTVFPCLADDNSPVYSDEEGKHVHPDFSKFGDEYDVEFGGDEFIITDVEDRDENQG